MHTYCSGVEDLWMIVSSAGTMGCEDMRVIVSSRDCISVAGINRFTLETFPLENFGAAAFGVEACATEAIAGKSFCPIFSGVVEFRAIMISFLKGTFLRGRSFS